MHHFYLASETEPCACSSHLGMIAMLANVIQDVGLPYMLDPRHPEDSLFFVAESDYRFYPQDCIESWYEVCMDESIPWLDENLNVVTEPSPAPAEEPSPSPAEGTASSPSPKSAATKAAPQKRKFMGWTAAQRTDRKAGEVEIAEELRDMVQICNRAAMIGRGHVIWFGWQSAGKRKSVPSFASHLVAVTKHGARMMLQSMEDGTMKKGHWDRVLRSWLVGENYQHPKVMGGSFVWPAVGYYQTHVSGCEPGIGVREAEWSISCVQAGVRPQKSGDQARWLACWPQGDKGGAEWLEKIVFDARKNTWITQRPPDRWWSTDNDWTRLLWNRYWVDRNGYWVGPKWAAEAKGSGKKQSPAPAHKQQSPSPANKWELLRKKPDEYEWDHANGRYMPVTRLAEQLVVDWDTWDWNGVHSAREWNTRKKAIAFYKRREFPITDEEEAIKTKHTIC